MKYHCSHGETPNLFGSAVIADPIEPTTGNTSRDSNHMVERTGLQENL